VIHAFNERGLAALDGVSFLAVKVLAQPSDLDMCRRGGGGAGMRSQTDLLVSVSAAVFGLASWSIAHLIT